MQERSFRWQHRDALKQIHFLQITVEKPIFVKKLLLAEISVLSVKE